MARIGELLATLLRRRTPDGDPLSDAVLLDRFTRTRDQAAFELLVWRHGPLVLASCRRMLRNGHTAEDAFQATFLVLARKAGSVRGAVAGWLHRVALRVCLRMKRRLPPVSLDTEPADSSSADPVEATEQLAILDEEVSRLPEFLRVPVIVCYLQGHTTEHAAAVLGIPRGTVLSRLATARKQLASQLVRRGVGPAVAVLAALSVTELSADVGRAVAETAIGFTLGKSPDTVPAQLALEVLAMTNRTAVVVAAGVLVLVAGLGTGIGFVAAQGQGQKPTPTTAPVEKKDKTPAIAPDDPKKAPPVNDTSVKGQLTKMLAEVDQQLAQSSELEGLKDEIRAHEQHRSNRVVIMLQEQAEKAQLEAQVQRASDGVAAARKTAVPADVLSAAVKLHPKAAEAWQKAEAKQNEIRQSKLPKDHAERKKLEVEVADMNQAAQAVEKEVTPEVEAYLRTPVVVEAQKSQSAAKERLAQFQERTMANRRELDVVSQRIAELQAQLSKLQPIREEQEWLKEKRKRLKMELFELELQSIGAVRTK